MRRECLERTRCLHLVASAGNPVDGSDRWGRLDGEFRRIPMGAGKIGRIGATGEPVLVRDASMETERMAHLEWPKREGIRSFAGQALVGPSGIFGVLGVFSRTELGEPEMRALCTFGDHAVVAIANARAFEEIADLNLRLERERNYLRAELLGAHPFAEIVGRSPAVRALLRDIDRVAPSETNVLVDGEAGTEKDLVAAAIHDRSPRRDGPFVRIHCAALPGPLLEAELFGRAHNPSGTSARRAGRVELAARGTLFLDGVDAIPLDLQAKLLRTLQEGRSERLEPARRPRVRVVSTSPRDLRRQVEAGRFRSDLYHSLTEFRMQLSPLRERKEDLELLASRFLRLAARSLNAPVPRLGPAELRRLEAYDWPGNLSELRNVLERAVLLAGNGPLPLDLALAGGRHDAEEQRGWFATESEMKRQERENLIAALDHTRWKIYGPGGAADLLGMKATTLASRILALGIERPPRTVELRR
jgi:transcriptional regulator with GAF, ATPase, and Fis domain